MSSWFCFDLRIEVGWGVVIPVLFLFGVGLELRVGGSRMAWDWELKAED